MRQLMTLVITLLSILMLSGIAYGINSVEVIKTGPDIATVGETVTYNFMINNLSSEDSPDLILDSVTDTLLGDLTSQATAAGCGTLGFGGTCNFTASRIIAPADPSTLENVVTVHYHPSGSLDDITDDDNHVVIVQAAPQFDLGDAPDSSNNYAATSMTAYPSGGPPGVVANFPTVYEVGSPPYGPRHNNPKALFFLGQSVSLENEADSGLDEDLTNNINPLNDTPNQDAVDDGITFPLSLQHCASTTFNYIVNVQSSLTQSMYVNVWFDWNRDGDWDDTMNCDGAGSAPEWAVQNQVLTMLPPGQSTLSTPVFQSWHPVGTSPPALWMRITLSEQALPSNTTPGFGGSGPSGGYSYGETEDYYLINTENNSFASPSIWTIHKQADQVDIILSPGQQFQMNYEIIVEKAYSGDIDECVDVIDTYFGMLGTVCEAASQFVYERIIGPYDVCGEYTVGNTASFVTNDTSTTGSDSWTINVSVPCSGCTLTPGYWKTHSEFGPAPYDDNWAQLSNGASTQFFLSGQTYYEVLWTPPMGGNAYYILAHAYIAAELNQLNGASVPVDVVTAFNEATTLFNTYTPADVAAAKGKNGKTLRNQFILLAATLDDYNNGYIGPGHCSEEPVAEPNVVINEIDYDQQSTDTAEFVEIKNNNNMAVDLTGWTLELINGTGGGATVYQTIALPSVTLAAGDYFVICGDAANVPNCDLDVSPDSNLLQNGAPDGMGLRDNNGVLVDAVSYEGDTGAPYTEGSGVGLVDTWDGSISRCPDGVDTDQNNSDFVFTGIITPGATNNCVIPPG